MAAVLIEVRSLQGSLGQAQKRFADYVLSNSAEIPFLSVHELAHASGVSVASISRFARAAGYKNFKEFKTQLGKDALSSFDAIYQAISPKDTDQDVIEKVFTGNIRSLEETLKLTKQRQIIRAAKTISTCSRMVFFGIGSSGYIAQDAALRFSQLDMQAEAHVDSYQMICQSLRMKKGDVALAISHSGRSAVTIQALQLAAKNKATTISISNYLKSPLHQASDIFLCTSFPESRVRVAALSSRIAQLCLIDVLYLLVARHRKAWLSKAELMNKYTEELLRVPGK